MSLDAEIAACASLLQSGDPARFRAVMAAPVDLRAKLFPLYAFNLEVARAPWVTQEPLIAEMRLQWWRDALEEIADGGKVRRHEVVTPLAATLDADGARALDGLVEARRADIEKGAPPDRGAVVAYIDATAGTLLWTAARLAGAQSVNGIRHAGRAQGLAAFLSAVPDLLAKGHHALPHGDPETEMAALAETGLAALTAARECSVPRQARPVLAVMAGVDAKLRRIRAAPAAALDGLSDAPALSQSLRTAWIVSTGRF
ncbi:MAG: squalene/phytoene synthase family protein [Jannaschia sp.]